MVVRSEHVHPTQASS